jgi:polar amino acid transport system substrate-binding protein
MLSADAKPKSRWARSAPVSPKAIPTPPSPQSGRTRTILLKIYSCLRIIFFVGLVAGGLPAGLSAQAPGAGADDDDDRAPPRRVAIRFLTESDFPPFNYLDEDNVLTGFNVDIARAICLELNTACDVQARPWGELLPALARGQADAVIASHAPRPNALKAVDFTDAYYFTPARFVAKRGSPIADVTPGTLEGKKIAVAKGTAHEAYLRAFFRDSAIRAYETEELARDALVGGETDILFGDGISLVFWLNGTASKACCEFKGGAFAEPKYFGDGIGVAIKRGDAQLKTMINDALRRLREGGRYEELLLRYFPQRFF